MADENEELGSKELSDSSHNPGRRICDAEHAGCGGLCKTMGDAYGNHTGQHICSKCFTAFGSN